VLPPETLPDELGELIAIQQLIASYALAIDERDYDRVAACFAEDAEVTYAGVELPVGRAPIRAWLEAHSDFVASTHLLAPPVVELDGERARTVTSAVAFLVREGRLHTRGLLYTDEMERRDGSWQIVRRVHEALWEATQPAETAPW
jgi:ketosteroid isomerase-like protein